ncbi:hypothetical protein QUB70_19205 [Microcoleus sp. A003_D6]
MIVFVSVTVWHRSQKLPADFCFQGWTPNDDRSVTTLPTEILS